MDKLWFKFTLLVCTFNVMKEWFISLICCHTIKKAGWTILHKDLSQFFLLTTCGWYFFHFPNELSLKVVSKFSKFLSYQHVIFYRNKKREQITLSVCWNICKRGKFIVTIYLESTSLAYIVTLKVLFFPFINLVCYMVYLYI